MSTKKIDGCPLKPESDRRNFLGLLLGLGAGVAAFFIPVYAGVKSVIFPLKQQGMGGKFYPITTIDSLTEEPQKFPIVDDVVDAWVKIPQKTIGNIFVRKTGENSVAAFQTLCPHAGCTLATKTIENAQTGQDATIFACPCHVAQFDLDGKRLGEKSDSPRNMDSLDTKIKNGKVYVKFQVFTFGVSEKKTS